MRTIQANRRHGARIAAALVGLAVLGIGLTLTQAWADDPSSYSPTVIKEDFETTMARMAAAKPEVMQRQMDILAERYDQSDRPAQGVSMSRESPFRKAS